MKCDEPDCYEAAVISIRKDLFGKSDAMRNLCSKHGPSWSMVSGKIPDAQGPSPLDVAQARIAALESDRDHLQRGFNAAISTVEAHQATIADLEARCAALLADVNQDEGYERLKTRVAELEAAVAEAAWIICDHGKCQAVEWSLRRGNWEDKHAAKATSLEAICEEVMPNDAKHSDAGPLDSANARPGAASGDNTLSKETK